MDLHEIILNFKKPNTPSELYQFLYLICQENIPHTPICPDHQTPWDLICSAFFNRKRNIMGIGNRKGGKTRSVAKLIVAEMFFIPQVEIASIGAIEKQAAKCFRYVNSFLHAGMPSLISKEVRAETRLVNGSTYEQLTASMSGTNSPHPHKLRADEVELMKPEILDELFLIPTSDSVRGIPANTLLISTRKYHSGVVQAIIEREDSDFNVINWCYKEVAESCPLERRGSGKRPYVIKDYLSTNLEGKSKETEIIAYSNCGSCPLLPSCRGDLAKSSGYLLIEDLISDFKKVDIRTWIYQMECRRVASSYRVYPQFDESVHVMPDLKYNANLPLDIAVDFGYSDPTCVLFFQYDEDTDTIYCIDQIYQSGLTTEQLAFKLKKKLSEYGLNMTNVRYSIGDSAQAQQIADLNSQWGFNFEPTIKINIASGLDKVRQYLMSISNGVHLFISPNCTNLIRELKNYRFKNKGGNMSEQPVTKDDHSPDCLRYYVVFIDSQKIPDLKVLV